MSRPDNTAQPSDRETDTNVGDPLVIANTVDRRLIHNLFHSTPPTLLLGLLAACVLAYVVWHTTGLAGAGYWLLLVAAITALRLSMMPALRRRLHDGNVRRIGIVSAVSAFANGGAWALIALFDDPGHAIETRLMILITLIGMPIAAMSSTAIYRPVFYAFATPIFGSMVLWSWYHLPDLMLEYSVLFTAYATLVFILAYRYNEMLRTSLMRDIENELLLREVGKMNDELQRLAYQDSLTGLSNRRSFEETTDQLLQRRRSHDVLALMLIDMDKFKWINDNLGHAAGDAALVELSRRIEKNSRVREMIVHAPVGAARIGGDEFVALYLLDAGSSIEPIATRILHALMKPMRFEQEEYRPGVSMGIALAPQHGETLDSLLRAADAAMYRAKQAGGGRYVIATPPVADTTAGAADAGV